MILGPIVACARRDELVKKALAGDQKAIAILVQLCPRDLPPRELARQRDDRLREIAMRFRSTLSVRVLARVLAAAGTRLKSPRGRLPDYAPFDRLDHDERAELAGEIRAILNWSPLLNWPDEDQIRRIINVLGGSFSPPRNAPASPSMVSSTLEEVDERDDALVRDAGQWDEP